MDRINKNGKLLIDYKKEYMKHYSPIVDFSLQTSVETLQSKNICDEKIAGLILDDSISLRDFETEVLSHREFLKTMKELAEEFDKLRGIVNNALVNQGFTRCVETENNIDNDCITVIKQYSITPEFIKIYFGLTDDEMPAVMKKRGFAEKFAVLRLSKIFKEIVSEIKSDTSEISQGFSRVYYNQSVDGFSVDYRYHINVNTIFEENIGQIIKKIQDIDRTVEKKFNIKTGIKFYNLQPIEIKKDISNTAQIQVPRNKGKEEIIDEKELDEIQNQLIKSKSLIDDDKENTQFIDTNKSIEKTEKVEDKNEVKNEVKNIKDNYSIEDNKKDKIVENKKEIKEENTIPNISLDIKDEEKSPFDDDLDSNIVLDSNELDETVIYEEEANNIKVEIDNSDDFLDGFVPQQVFSMDNEDIPGDEDFGSINAPDDEDIDFT